MKKPSETEPGVFDPNIFDPSVFDTGRLVFISHNHADKPRAAPLAIYLVAESIGVFYDDWEVAPGDSLVGRIASALGSCTHFLLVWSKHSAASRWVGTEVETALASAIQAGRPRIIPVLLDDTPLNPLLAPLKYIRLSEDREEARVQVVGAITGRTPERLLVKALVDLFNEVVYDYGDEHFSYCPRCGSDDLGIRRESEPDGGGVEFTYCSACGYEAMTDYH